MEFLCCLQEVHKTSVGIIVWYCFKVIDAGKSSPCCFLTSKDFSSVFFFSNYKEKWKEESDYSYTCLHLTCRFFTWKVVIVHINMQVDNIWKKKVPWSFETVCSFCSHDRFWNMWFWCYNEIWTIKRNHNMNLCGAKWMCTS